MAFFSEAVGHAAMTGIAVGVLLGENLFQHHIFPFTYIVFIWIDYQLHKEWEQRCPQMPWWEFFLQFQELGGSLLLIYVSGKVNMP